MKYRIALSYINREFVETTPFTLVCKNKKECIETLIQSVFTPFIFRGEYYRIRILKPDMSNCVCSIRRNVNKEAGLSEEWIKFESGNKVYWTSPTFFIHDRQEYPIYDGNYNFKTYKSMKRLFNDLLTESAVKGE